MNKLIPILLLWALPVFGQAYITAENAYSGDPAVLKKILGTTAGRPIAMVLTNGGGAKTYWPFIYPENATALSVNISWAVGSGSPGGTNACLGLRVLAFPENANISESANSCSCTGVTTLDAKSVGVGTTNQIETHTYINLPICKCGLGLSNQPCLASECNNKIAYLEISSPACWSSYSGYLNLISVVINKL